jgi:triphosphoribosyl-dephospho-CoA synthase
MMHLVTIERPRWRMGGRDPASLAALATQALIAEVELTPKPGLVDRRGPGPHTDLSLDLMKRSAETLEPFFQLMAEMSGQLPYGQTLREQLGRIGRNAEHAMYRTTGGTNTHKGAIWTLGLLVAAAGHTGQVEAFELANVAGSIARLPDRAAPELVTHGSTVQSHYGVTGARGEAYADFPHVIDVGLPVLRATRVEGRSETASRLCALLAIMTELDDTCVLYRSGAEGAQLVKDGASAALRAGGPETATGDAALIQFDQELFVRRISPGGSADLLAATIFLDCLEFGRQAAEQSGKYWESAHGTN